MANDVYTSPLASRYASPYMLHLFSPDSRFQTWRRLWVALARAQHQLGLPITAEQIAELEAHRDDINYVEAEARERGDACTQRSDGLSASHGVHGVHGVPFPSPARLPVWQMERCAREFIIA